ncbi:MAG: Dyp-type peroxidase [Steroidobacteraceae bacterium]
MSPGQPGILAPVPPVARYLTFELGEGAAAPGALGRLAATADGASVVAGVGRSLVRVLGRDIPRLRDFPSRSGAGFELPATGGALWCWLRGEDRGDLVHRTRALVSLLSPAFRLDEVVDAFRHGDGRDLTGYQDGTENPVGDAAVEAACTSGAGPGHDGGSCVAVQRWRHDYAAFDAMGRHHQDLCIGRRRDDNGEIDDAPPSAHVKRTAQESFDPEAFVLRRSMPWSDGRDSGLQFVAFGRTFDAFEAQLRRMAGDEDGIADALFGFTRPVTGAYFWCPPVKAGRLDLRALGLG